jgi:hypothetical protein
MVMVKAMVMVSLYIDLQNGFKDDSVAILDMDKIVDIITNGDCCFNHLIGLPKKNTEDKPFFDYEKLLFDNLQQHKHFWIKKATGLDI